MNPLAFQFNKHIFYTGLVAFIVVYIYLVYMDVHRYCIMVHFYVLVDYLIQINAEPNLETR